VTHSPRAEAFAGSLDPSLSESCRWSAASDEIAARVSGSASSTLIAGGCAISRQQVLSRRHGLRDCLAMVQIFDLRWSPAPPSAQAESREAVSEENISIGVDFV